MPRRPGRGGRWDSDSDDEVVGGTAEATPAGVRRFDADDSPSPPPRRRRRDSTPSPGADSPPPQPIPARSPRGSRTRPKGLQPLDVSKSTHGAPQKPPSTPAALLKSFRSSRNLRTPKTSQRKKEENPFLAGGPLVEQHNRRRNVAMDAASEDSKGTDDESKPIMQANEGPVGYISSDDEQTVPDRASVAASEGYQVLHPEQEVVCVAPVMGFPSKILPFAGVDDRQVLKGSNGSCLAVVSEPLLGTSAETKEAQECLPVPRDCEAEGLYVPPRPYVTDANKRRFQVRVAREMILAPRKGLDGALGQAKRGFGDAAAGAADESLPGPPTRQAVPDHVLAGELVPHMGDPIETHHARLDNGPPLNEYNNRRKDARLELAVSRPIASATGEVEQSTATRLDVVIHQLEFFDHALFCYEDWLYSGMRVLYKEYSRRLQAGVAGKLVDRLEVLLGGDFAHDTDHGAARCTDVLESLSVQHTELQTLKQLTHDIYAKWQELKATRREQGEVYTPAQLQVRTVGEEGGAAAGAGGGDDDDALAMVGQRLVDRAEELLEHVHVTVPGFGLGKKGRALLRTVRRSLRDRISVVLRLTHDGAYSDPPTRSDARSRVTAAKRVRLFCRLTVNGQEVGSTPVEYLQWPRFRANFRVSMPLQLVRRPKSIQVEIRHKGYLWDSVLAQVLVPVPGMDSEEGVGAPSFAPTDEWYHFSSSTPIPPRQWRFPRQRLAKEGDRGRGVGHQRFTMGSLRVAVAWGGDFGQAGGMGLQIEAGAGTVLLPDKAAELTGDRVLKVTGVDDAPGYKREGVLPEHAMRGSAEDPDDENMDPNDPRNRDFFRVQEYAKMAKSRGKKFRLRALKKDLAFGGARGMVSGEDLAASKRHRLLQLRMDQPEKFSDPIPLADREIQHNPKWESLLLFSAPANDDAGGAVTEDEDDDEVESALKAKALVRIRNFAKEAAKRASGWTKRHRVSLKDVVEEGPLPNFKTFSPADVLKVVEPRHKLRPKPRSRQHLAGGKQGDKPCTFFIKVVRGQNVPVRRSGRARGGRSRYDDRDRYDRDYSRRGRQGVVEEAEEEGKVSSYCELRYGKEKPVRTSGQPGTAPRWDEDIRIKFQPPHNSDTSPQALLSIYETLTLSLFDEQRRVQEDDGGLSSKRVSYESSYLGSITIPFTTIYMAGRISGLFELKMPPVNLGYKHIHHGELTAVGAATARSAAVPTAPGANGTGRTFVYLMITLDPPLPLPNPPLLPPPKGEQRRLMAYARRWEARHSRRNVQALVLNSTGNWVLMNRYLRPQAPPPDYIVFNAEGPSRRRGSMGDEPPLLDTPEKVARFVSLIPFLADWETFMGDQDLWCTSQEFLDLGYGDWEEHAILLANYFMYLNREAGGDEWDTLLVLGQAVPEGDSVYVLRHFLKRGDVELWNAVSGKRYRPTDKACPLKSVSMVASGDNMWANVQSVTDLGLLSWDVRDQRAWARFYTADFPREDKSFVQEEELKYKKPSVKMTRALQRNLYSKLVTRIRQWRSRYTVDFNLDIKQDLDSLCIELERQSLGDDHDRVDHVAALSRKLSRMRVTGFPLNIPFTDVEAVYNEVLKTNIHRIENSLMELALSVRVFPYVNNVASVWIYIAALVPE